MSNDVSLAYVSGVNSIVIDVFVVSKQSSCGGGIAKQLAGTFATGL